MDPVKSSTISCFSKFWKGVSNSNTIEKTAQKLMQDNLIFLAGNDCKVTYGKGGELRTRTSGENNGFKWNSSVLPANMKVFCNTVKKFAQSSYFTHCNKMEVNDFLGKILKAIEGLNKLQTTQYKGATADKIAILEKSKQHLQDGAKCLTELLGIIQLIEDGNRASPFYCFDSIEEDLNRNRANRNDTRYKALGLTHRNGIIKPIEQMTFNPVKQIALNSTFEASMQRLPLILNQLETMSLEARELYTTAFFCRHLELKSAVADAEALLEDLYEPLPETDGKEVPQLRKLKEGFDDELLQANKKALEEAKQALITYHKELAAFGNSFSSRVCATIRFSELETQFIKQFGANPELMVIYNDLASKPETTTSKALVKQQKEATRSVASTKTNALAFTAMGIVGTGAIVGSTLCPPAAPFILTGTGFAMSGIEVAREGGVEGVKEALSKLNQEDVAKGMAFVSGIVQAVFGPQQPDAPPADAATAPANSPVPQIAASKGPKVEKAPTDDES